MPAVTGTWMGISSAIAGWLSPLTAPDQRIDVVGGVTLVTLLLTSEPTWVIQAGVVSLASAAVIDRRLLRSAAYWFAILALYVVGVSRVALLIDNHEWLLGYWVFALGISRVGTAPLGSLATSARLLIGLAFAFATLWKVATPDYVSGNAFHSFLLFDTRFVGVGPALSDLTLSAVTENYRVFELVRATADSDVSFPVSDAIGVRRIALFMTWWTVAIEGIVAICFLTPPQGMLGQARHVVLLTFLFTTYVLAPVQGFGWLLIAMGLAEAPLDRHRWMLPAFALAFIVVIFRATAPVDRLLLLLT